MKALKITRAVLLIVAAALVEDGGALITFLHTYVTSLGTAITLAFVAAIVFAVSWLIHLLYIVSVRAAKQ